MRPRNQGNGTLVLFCENDGQAMRLGARPYFFLNLAFFDTTAAFDGDFGFDWFLCFLLSTCWANILSEFNDRLHGAQ